MVQSAVIKSYQEERERAKQPGYVCTYDDYDDGDYEGGPAFSETQTRNAAGENTRTHPPHGPRGTHTARHGNGHESTTSVAAREDNRSDGFGAGIL